MESEPNMDVGTAYLVRAFAECSTERQVGFTIGPIPRSALVTWAREKNLDHDVTDHLIRVLRSVDSRMLVRARAAANAPTRKR